MTITSNKKRYKICAFFHDIKFGKNVRITGIPRWASESYLIEIGNNVTITQNVVFHTHDGGVHLFRKEHPGMNVFGKIRIGNNVFIGSNVIIMPNVTIGNNVVVGSGSIVTKDISDNLVVAGTPARPIKEIDQYYKACLEKCIFVPSGLNSKARKQFIIDNLNR